MAKISKMGNSAGIYLPKEALEAVGLVIGDEVEVRPRGSLLELVPIEKRERLRPAVREAADRTIGKFGPALERLAK